MKKKNGNETYKNCQDLYIFKMVKGKCGVEKTVKPVKCYTFPRGFRYHLNIELGMYLLIFSFGCCENEAIIYEGIHLPR